ncbi:hypothetical protein P3T40_001985 [Paraburkholderia sp. EB58]|uniref:hypothetical protein n=1 Tax=Paraburkholderia sp. EB58 TaxID=3035125 RepID=UPI003D1ECF88
MSLKAVIQKIASWFRSEAKVGIEVVSDIIEKESQMDASQSAVPVAASANNVNTAVQIALALKAIDASLSVDAIQAGTNAALAALYPVA